MLRTIDDSDARARGVNYDESDDEEETKNGEKAEESADTTIQTPAESSAILAVVDDADLEFELGCDEIQDVLGPPQVLYTQEEIDAHFSENVSLAALRYLLLTPGQFFIALKRLLKCAK